MAHMHVLCIKSISAEKSGARPCRPANKTTCCCLADLKCVMPLWAPSVCSVERTRGTLLSKASCLILHQLLPVHLCLHPVMELHLDSIWRAADLDVLISLCKLELALAWHVF